MRPAVPISLTPEERARLRGWRDGPDSSVRLARRARIVLEASEGRTNRAIAQELSLDPETVALWRRRFSMNRLDGIRWDAPRSGRRPRLSADVLERIGRVPPRGLRPDGSIWTTRQLAQSLGVSHMRVHRAWQAQRLGDRELSSGRHGSALLAVRQIDVAGVYLAPPGRAIVFQVERFFEPQVPSAVIVEPPAEAPPESSHTGWDGLVGTLERWGFESATANRRTSSAQDLLVFLRAVDSAAPRRAELHVLLDSFSAEATRRIEGWLQARRSRFHRYRVPAGSPWAETVDRWWGRWLAQEKIGSSSRHVGQCAESLAQFLGRQNAALAPFAWTPAYPVRG